MTRAEFAELDSYMRGHMQDSAHDVLHVNRVLYAALDIGETEQGVDTDILITACMLHDIGRERQYGNPELCHARVGGDMAFEYLKSRGWDDTRARHVMDCVVSHRYRSDNPPVSIEAKILFDADKLDVSGAMGIARTLQYEARVSEPLYVLNDGRIMLDGGGDDCTSFFQEYNYKLKRIYDGFYTERARQVAVGRRKAAEDFYNALYDEIMDNHRFGMGILDNTFS